MKITPIDKIRKNTGSTLFQSKSHSVIIRTKYGGTFMNIKRLIFYGPIMLTLALAGCTGSMMGGQMGGYGHAMGYGGWYMWLIWILIAVIIIYFVVNLGKKTGNGKGTGNESPIEILKRRYAKGEITKEEYERMKREIEN